MIKSILEKLNKLGYSVELENGFIRYEALSGNEENKKAAAEYIRQLRDNVEAVRAELLQSGNFYAFPEIKDDSNPFTEERKKQTVKLVGLKQFFEVIKKNIADAPNGYMPLMYKYQKAYSEPLRAGTEYPVVCRRQSITYMVKPYRVIKAYAQKGIARLEYREKYDMLIMIFNDIAV